MDKEKFALILTSKKFQILGVMISIGFVVFNIFQLSILEESVNNYTLQRSILIGTTVFFGLLACIGIGTFIYSKKKLSQ